ncbi:MULTISPECIES: nitrogenase cofactor biosynthesis protein NifB [Rhizobium]|uniref:nitrogenase cofactor biosynthesis protein NifB n=1 Tax=Rhizobium TaxID=379 RepID=UPI001441B283|nr:MULTISPECIES: nitrogenase cofactor biosynthesis protein NifB [Rhizobium]NKK74683.1 nitrogenase cofactor biosynthesis protein NifB [Rhizobium leguminosarum bv. viciae]MBX4863521.1 nitrogenase cofactor biosynthesis protein NifB [Rhizobium bangladeshense]MBX4905033.1 nitrogenase cofactor biosynthesis protein NifB [Rhizobium bangladeshense]MBX4925640.1 nitrogenase cofactor biosynthesis protein NifB [Rhizobium binae]MBX5173470.1 nitrogenase cofactor biosynthesis protein NifB [Rhizobium sp. NZLR1
MSEPEIEVGMTSSAPFDRAPMAPAMRGGRASSSYDLSVTDDMDARIWERIKDHPCFSEQAHHYFARMHVAVAPACNIQCNYCNRKYDCTNESRPGVASVKLTPDQALRKVIAVASKVPELSVIGIAGPGDACYDWKKTVATFEGVAREIPDIKLCISTNGLALPDHVDELADMNVDHVTITINMVDPEVGAKIYPWILHGHRRYTGIEGARILHERQMLGLEMLTERGILTKINSVMIPGVNDTHLVEVNQWIRDRGAFMHNVVPLISKPSHGTYYGLTGQRCPEQFELKALQDCLDGNVKLMRHCQQCRADAIGLLGDDREREFALDQISTKAGYDANKREVYRKLVEHEREDQFAAKLDANKAVKSLGSSGTLVVAVATKGGGRINEHFGQVRELQLYAVSRKGINLVGHRKVLPYCLGGVGKESALDQIIVALDGIDILLSAKIGDGPKKRLAKAGVRATDAFAYAYIETAIGALYIAEFGRKPSMPTALPL